MLLGELDGMNLLLVDDDRELCRMMQDYLGSHGFEVEAVHEGTQGLAKALTGAHALVLLDGMLPGLDGLELLRQLRRRSNIPVIMLTARGTPQQRVLGLETGADDYLAKPFTPDELLARVKAVLRRASSSAITKPESLEVGGVKINAAQREAWLAQSACQLTSLQFEILEYLMRHNSRAVSRDELTAILHQRESTPFERWLDVHISQLRKKVEADGKQRIHTVRGVGYMFSAPEDDSR